HLDAEFARQAARQSELDAALRSRLDTLEQQLKAMVEQQANSVSASVGELADRIERGPSRGG
ncbi:MAG: LapA family protein, partial [Burkholderiaceae bacterium]|nr:LapA family protein [Burkholderiaceae bacterium]